MNALKHMHTHIHILPKSLLILTSLLYFLLELCLVLDIIYMYVYIYIYIYIYIYTHTHICFLSIPSHQNVSSENFVWYAPGQWISSRWTVILGSSELVSLQHIPTWAPAFPGPSSQPLQQGLCLNPQPHVDQHPTASEDLYTQWWLAVGQPGHQACHPDTLSSWRSCPG